MKSTFPSPPSSYQCYICQEIGRHYFENCPKSLAYNITLIVEEHFSQLSNQKRRNLTRFEFARISKLLKSEKKKLLRILEKEDGIKKELKIDHLDRKQIDSLIQNVSIHDVGITNIENLSESLRVMTAENEGLINSEPFSLDLISRTSSQIYLNLISQLTLKAQDLTVNSITPTKIEDRKIYSKNSIEENPISSSKDSLNEKENINGNEDKNGNGNGNRNVKQIDSTLSMEHQSRIDKFVNISNQMRIFLEFHDSSKYDHDFKDPNLLKLKKQISKEQSKNGTAIALDFSYMELMNSFEKKSLQTQLLQIYGINLRSEFPSRLIFSNFKEESFKSMTGFQNWTIEKYEEHYSQLFDREKTIVLSPDSPSVLTDVSKENTYVIGAFIDRTVKKNASLDLATKHGFQTARLPLAEFSNLNLKRSSSLPINQVFGLLQFVLQKVDWKTAIRLCIPYK